MSILPPPTPYFTDGPVTLFAGDCLDILREMPTASVDAVVTDPPYGLGFMGKEWDDLPPGREWAEECLRVLKPGGHMLAFGGSRTWHRLAAAVEDAGFEIRDSIAWLYGSGFPKSLDVSKAIDKAAGAEREAVGPHPFASRKPRGTWTGEVYGDEPSHLDGPSLTAPATDAARTWQGWGTALKPAFEPIVVARKPLAGTVAANVLTHGTGALNIDGCRLAPGDGGSRAGEASARRVYQGIGGDQKFTMKPGVRGGSADGRWPANVILDDTQAAELDQQSGEQRDGVAVNRNTDPDARKPSSVYGAYLNGSREDQGYGGGGGASRFFYVAKADATERVKVNGTAHPTVKPLDLMRWLVRLVTPPGGTVLEPFAGSGTTVEACLLEGFRCIAIEREADYLPLIRQRIARRRDPVEAVRGSGEDGGLFDLLDGEAS